MSDLMYPGPPYGDEDCLTESEVERVWEWQDEQRWEIEEQQEDWMQSVHGCANPFLCETCGLGGALMTRQGYGTFKMLCHSCADVQPEADFWEPYHFDDDVI